MIFHPKSADDNIISIVDYLAHAFIIKIIMYSKHM